MAGVDVASDPIEVRSRLGFMPEHECLPLDQTAADVVSTFGELSGLPPRAARQRASDILDLVGLDEARFRPIGGFSTGMRQRTKLAQAIVGDPELVLLDEPTAGLDPIGREEMLALVGRLGSFGISVVMATHLLDDVQQVCDHVVMIDAGRLVVAGATESLLERTGRVTVDVGPQWRRARGRPVAGRARRDARSTGRRGRDRTTTPTSIASATSSLISSLPLYRLTTALTSLDEVFLDQVDSRVTASTLVRCTTAATGRTPGRAGSAARRPSRSTGRRSVGRSACVARGGRRWRRSFCSPSSRSRRSSTSASAT